MTVSFREMVGRVRPGTARTWMPHHATSHVTRQAPSKNFWQKGNILVFPQPPYSPDLSLSDFFISPAQKSLERQHLGNLDHIQKSVTDKLNGIPAEAFQHCYEK